MSKKISTSNIDKFGKIHNKNILLGDCIFPYVYNGKTYYECYNGKTGKWCPTKLTRNKTIKKWAYCKPHESLKASASTKSSPKAKRKRKKKLTKLKISSSPKSISIVTSKAPSLSSSLVGVDNISPDLTSNRNLHELNLSIGVRLNELYTKLSSGIKSDSCLRKNEYQKLENDIVTSTNIFLGQNLPNLYTFRENTTKPIGLPQVGNSCFLSSLLQCILKLDTLWFILQIPDSQFDKFINKSLYKTKTIYLIHLLRHLVQNYLKHINKKALPSKIYKAYHKDLYNNEFIKLQPLKGYKSQEDTHEILTILLDTLSLELNNTIPILFPKYIDSKHSPYIYRFQSLLPNRTYDGEDKHPILYKNYSYSRNLSLIDLLFGYLPFDKRRYTCHSSSKIFNNFKFSNLSKTIELPINVKSTIDLSKLIEGYLQEEELKGDELPKFCDGNTLCKTAFKQLHLYNTGSYLVILLKRTNYDMEKGVYKNNVNIDINKEIVIPQINDEELNLDKIINKRYRLKGVIYHHGINVASGHYTCTVLNSDSTWSYCDDSNISQLDDRLHNSEYLFDKKKSISGITGTSYLAFYSII